MVKLFFICFLLMCLSAVGHAITCYHCQSDINPECAYVNRLPDNEKFKYASDCNTLTVPASLPRDSVPRKCSTVVRSVGGVNEVTTRSCYFQSPTDRSTRNCYVGPHEHVALVKCTSCESNYCNST